MDKGLSNKNTIIWLSNLGFTSKAIRNLMEDMEDICEIWTMSNNDISKLSLSKKNREKILNNRKKEDLFSLLKKIRDLNVNVITIYDENYPEKLRHIPNRPKILYTKGLELKEDFSIAIVGSRKSTNYGRWACMKFAEELARYRVSIISGLALGIDAIAHGQALESGVYTIAVLGCGIDVVYPKKNEALYEKIMARGTIVTEYPLGRPPLPYNFPERNRIIAGLSDGIIIVEAKDRSGTLITANHGLEQGKDVYAVPGNINSIFSSGTNGLIRDGAIPLLSIEDIVNENEELKYRIQDLSSTELLDSDDFSETEKRLLILLEEAPMHSDNIVYNLSIDIATVNTMLVGLELKGAVKEVANNVFMKC